MAVTTTVSPLLNSVAEKNVKMNVFFRFVDGQVSAPVATSTPRLQLRDLMQVFSCLLTYSLSRCTSLRTLRLSAFG